MPPFPLTVEKSPLPSMTGRSKRAVVCFHQLSSGIPANSERKVVSMRKIAWLLALLVSALDVTSSAAHRSNPSTTTDQSSVQAHDNQLQTACPGHGHEPGGSAVDINEVNGKPVSLYGKDPDVTKAVNDLQAAANRSGSGEPGAAAANYGPAGLWRNGKPVRDSKLQNRFHDHVHILPLETRESK
jgi:hypothetical protein